MEVDRRAGRRADRLRGWLLADASEQPVQHQGRTGARRSTGTTRGGR